MSIASVLRDDKTVRRKLINICNPLELGKIENTDKTHFVLENFWKNHFKKMLAQSGQPHPTVETLRRWTNQPNARGLPREIQNLLILVYVDHLRLAPGDLRHRFPPHLLRGLACKRDVGGGRAGRSCSFPSMGTPVRPACEGAGGVWGHKRNVVPKSTTVRDA